MLSLLTFFFPPVSRVVSQIIELDNIKILLRGLFTLLFFSQKKYFSSSLSRLNFFFRSTYANACKQTCLFFSRDIYSDPGTVITTSLWMAFTKKSEDRTERTKTVGFGLMNKGQAIATCDNDGVATVVENQQSCSIIQAYGYKKRSGE